jgi:ring-1,2-phenylacetyl-CoA epoxidase subunit PaaD
VVTATDIARARKIAGAVEDPELPPITISDLGVLRNVSAGPNGQIIATITPTYSGCPANAVIALDVEAALLAAGFAHVRVETEWAPAWSSADISSNGRAKLGQMGIAPPGTTQCPRCDSAVTEEISLFGATACKSLWRCNACREPFEVFKTI